MKDLKEAIRAAFKELILPEIEVLRRENQEIKAHLHCEGLKRPEAISKIKCN